MIVVVMETMITGATKTFAIIAKNPMVHPNWMKGGCSVLVVSGLTKAALVEELKNWTNSVAIGARASF